MSTTRTSVVAMAKTQTPSAPSTPAVVQEVIRAPGTPLAPSLRDSFERRLGHSLDNVRIHNDSRAADSARAVHARAYNVGSDIVFGAGQFAPATSGGKQLLTHELTHVIQQRGREPGPPSAAAETEADSIARDSGGAAPISIRAGSHPQALQRSPADDKAIDEILKAATAALAAKTPGAGSNTVIIKLVERYLPQWRQRIGKAGFDAAAGRVAARAGAKADTIDVNVAKSFLSDAQDASQLRALANELETAFASTRVQPTAEVEPDVSKVGAVATADRAPGYSRQAVGAARDVMAEIGKRDYWHAKVFSRFFVRETADTTSRFAANAEERDAVLSVAWKEQPPDFKRAVQKHLTIPPRGKGTKPLFYQINYLPIDSKLDKKRPVLEVIFLAADSAATVAKAQVPFRDFVPQQPAGVMFGGFPTKDLKSYWKAHPEEHKHVFFFMEKDAPNPFDQMLEVTTGSASKPVVTTFSLKGRRDPKTGDLQDVTIILRDFSVTSSTAPADYRKAKDAGDFELERVQEKLGEKLGKLDLPRDISASEASQVKFMLAAYFEEKVRNQEVDARISADAGEVLYTFRFLAGNDVQAVRVGTPKKGSRLDIEKLDIGRSREFMDIYRSGSASSLSTYLGKRYPKVTPAGKTVAELRVSANKEIEAKANAPQWFADNYDLEVLKPKEAAERLQKVHKMKAQQTADLKKFEQPELRLVEQSLETLSLEILAKLKGTKLARQKVLIEPKKSGTGFTTDPKTAGIVNAMGKEQTLRLFDQYKVNKDDVFIGGKYGAMRREAFTITHEFSHVAEKSDEILKKFDAFVAREGIQPFTEYSAGDPKEFFADAFALYNADPEWLKANQPRVFEWLDAVSKTGKPPP